MTKKKESQGKPRPAFVIDFETPIRISMLVAAPGRAEGLELIHVFKPPTAEEKLKYYDRLAQLQTTRNLAAVKEADGKKETEAMTSMRAAVEFWDSLILKVEGDYQFPRGMDFKEAMPPEHKSWAINLLMQTTGILIGSEVKNSSGTSAITSMEN